MREGRSIAARPTRAVAVRIASAWRAGSMIGCSAPGEREVRCDDA
ncbi:transposase, partial [Burkholderia pseudomallei]